jgi:uncharacterized protein with HEPN domain
MIRDFRNYINDILNKCDYLIEGSKNLDYYEFIENDDLVRAFIRSLEIIGEAVKNIPNEIKNRDKSIPWRDIANMRNLLIHEYFGIDYEIVWDTIKNDIPVLREKIKKLI